MTRADVYERLKGIFEDVFDREILIDDSTTARMIDGWDSFQNITLMGAIEDEFDLKFSIQDVVSFKSVGTIVDLILDRESLK